MKNRAIFYLFVFLGFLATCKKQSSDSNSNAPQQIIPYPVTINVKINDFDNRFPFEFHGYEQDYRLIKNDTNLQINFEISKPVLCEFGYISKFKLPLFARPGDVINIKLDPPYERSELLQPEYSGSSTAENKLLFKLRQLIRSEDQKNYQLYAKEEIDFLNTLDELKIKSNDLYHSNSDKIKNKEDFKKHFDTYLDYKLATLLRNFPDHKRKYFDRKDFVMSETIKKRLSNLMVEDTTLLSNRLYQDFLLHEVYKESSEFADPHLKFQHMNAIFQKKEIKDFLNLRIMMDELASFELIKRLHPIIEENKAESQVVLDNNWAYEASQKFKRFIEDYKETIPPADYLLKIEKSFQQSLQ